MGKKQPPAQPAAAPLPPPAVVPPPPAPCQAILAAPVELSGWQRVIDAVKDLARPVIIYANGLACAAAVFVPSATVDKMMVLAAVSGAVGWMHGDTKTKLAQIGAAINGDGK